MTFTAEQIAELRALAAKATPGPWKVGTGYEQSDPGNYVAGGDDVGSIVCAGQDDTDCPLRSNDARFIAAACNAVPALLDELEKLREYANGTATFMALHGFGTIGPTRPLTDEEQAEENAKRAKRAKER